METPLTLDNKKVTVLYAREYIGRVIYVLEYKGQYIMTYLSSGFSGTGHKGELLPFNFLSEQHKLSVVAGYLFKEMFYNNTFINHMKRLERYPEVNAFLIDIRNSLIKLNVEEENFKITSIEAMCEHATTINSEMKTAIGDRTPFDLQNLEQ